MLHAYIHTTIGYIEELLRETVKVCEEGSSVELPEAPEPLCSGYERPQKIVAISQHKTRFSTFNT